MQAIPGMAEPALQFGRYFQAIAPQGMDRAAQPRMPRQGVPLRHTDGGTRQHRQPAALASWPTTEPTAPDAARPASPAPARACPGSATSGPSRHDRPRFRTAPARQRACYHSRPAGMSKGHLLPQQCEGVRTLQRPAPFSCPARSQFTTFAAGQTCRPCLRIDPGNARGRAQLTQFQPARLCFAVGSRSSAPIAGAELRHRHQLRIVSSHVAYSHPGSQAPGAHRSGCLGAPRYKRGCSCCRVTRVIRVFLPSMPRAIFALSVLAYRH